MESRQVMRLPGGGSTGLSSLPTMSWHDGECALASRSTPGRISPGLPWQRSAAGSVRRALKYRLSGPFTALPRRPCSQQRPTRQPARLRAERQSGVAGPLDSDVDGCRYFARNASEIRAVGSQRHAVQVNLTRSRLNVRDRLWETSVVWLRILRGDLLPVLVM